MINIDSILNNKFIRFAISGGIATIVDLSLLYTFTEFFHIWYLFSAALSFVVGSITHYSISRLWVFSSNNGDRIKEFISFFTIHSMNLSISLTLVFILVEYAQMWYILAKILTVLITTFVNFFLQRKFTFNKAP